MREAGMNDIFVQLATIHSSTQATSRMMQKVSLNVSWYDTKGHNKGHKKWHKIYDNSRHSKFPIICDDMILNTTFAPRLHRGWNDHVDSCVRACIWSPCPANALVCTQLKHERSERCIFMLAFFSTSMMSVVLSPKAPAIVFSSGLFNTMPSTLYQNVLGRIRQNVTVHNYNGPLTRRSFEDLCDTLEADKMPLVAHSSFDSSLLGSHRLERVLLLDPATMPSLGVTGAVPTYLDSRAPVRVIESRLYDKFVPRQFRPRVQNAIYEQAPFGGHSDFLDPMWTRAAKAIGIPSDPSTRAEYRDYIVEQVVLWACGSVYQ